MVQEVHFVDLDGIRTRWASEGEGTPVVLVHGGGAGYAIEVWSDVVALLAPKGWRVIALELPGHGETEPSPLPITTVLARFLESVCEEPVHLVGHSHNGAHVMAVALDTPRLLRSAVAVGTGRMLPGYDLEARTAVQQSAGRPSARPPSVESVRESLRRDVYSPESLTDDRIEPVYRFSAQRYEHRGVLQGPGVARVEGDEGPPLWSRLSEAKVPLMAVFGDADKNQASVLTPRLVEECPSVRVELIPRCAHLVQWDAPETLVGYLDAFFRSVES